MSLQVSFADPLDRRHASILLLASANDKNQFAFRHPSRRQPLNAATGVLSVGARDQLLVFLSYLGQVEPTNNSSERLLRPSVVQRKMTNGYRAMWAAEGEANIRTVARLVGGSPFGAIFKTVGA